MSNTPTKPDEDLQVDIIGNPEEGQTIQLGRDNALQTIFGTKHPEMAEALMQHCLKVLRTNEASDDYPGHDERKFMLTVISEIKPRDAVERMLAVQMAATHVALIRSGGWLSKSDNLEQAKTHISGYTKLTRAFSAQMEALRKHRNGGKQTVTVQHVNVGDGGQAIVGNVETGGGQ